MKRIKITESQLKEILREDKVRSYMFDWDDNILYMPTKIKMDALENGKWVPEDVSTEKYAHVRNLDNYRLRNNNPDMAYEAFRIDDDFIKDTYEAIKGNSFAPSFDKFIEALKYANSFAIITARGHSPEALRHGTEIVVDKVMSVEDRRFMVKSILRNNPELEGESIEDIIDSYLDSQEYHPVSSSEFQDRFKDTHVDPSNVEVGKKLAVADFVKQIVLATSYSIKSGKDIETLSFGFSDDDKRNVKVIEDLIEDELSKLYPGVNFVVYDTQDEKNVIKIRKA